MVADIQLNFSIMNDKLGRKFTYLLIGTKEIEAWTPAKPFIEVLTDKEDVLRNGVEYDDIKDMKIGEVRKDDDLEGIIYIRVS